MSEISIHHESAMLRADTPEMIHKNRDDSISADTQEILNLIIRNSLRRSKIILSAVIITYPWLTYARQACRSYISATCMPLSCHNFTSTF